jgi:exonuclease SbcD
VIPYPVRQRLLTREQFRRLDREGLDRAVTKALVDIIQELSAAVTLDVPAVLMAHLSVESAHWGSERSIMIGRDVAVPLSALTDPVWDYVALGHIHQHQELNGGAAPPVVYSGSLERVDFGEEKQPKGFCWVEVQRGQTEWRYIEVPARPFVTIRVDVRAAAAPQAEIREALAAHNLDGAVARLVIQMTPEQESQWRDADLTPLFANTFFAQINRDVDRATRDRLEGLSPEAMTPEHLLQAYLLSRNKPQSEVTAYLEEARTFFAEDGPD